MNITYKGSRNILPNLAHKVCLNNTISRQTPGPGAYNNCPINSITAELSRKAILESCRKGVFGTTTPRVLPLSKKQDAIIPGPGMYEPKEEPTGEYHSVIAKKKTANFVSTSKRLHSPPPIVRDIPPPGS